MEKEKLIFTCPIICAILMGVLIGINSIFNLEVFLWQKILSFENLSFYHFETLFIVFFFFLTPMILTSPYFFITLGKYLKDKEIRILEQKRWDIEYKLQQKKGPEIFSSTVFGIDNLAKVSKILSKAGVQFEVKYYNSPEYNDQHHPNFTITVPYKQKNHLTFALNTFEKEFEEQKKLHNIEVYKYDHPTMAETSLANSKWQNLETEHLASKLVKFCQDQGSWNAFPLEEFSENGLGYHKLTKEDYEIHGLPNKPYVFLKKDFIEEVLKKETNDSRSDFVENFESQEAENV